jgi:type I restriction enzyme S subunit
MGHLNFMEKLLDGVAVEWKPLGDAGEVRMCKRILKNQTSSDGEIPFYKIGTFGKAPNAYIPRKLFEEYKSKYSYPKIGEILISASGTIGRVVIFDGDDAYFQDSNIVWIENDESIVLNKFLFYFYRIANWGISEGGTIQRLYNDNLRKLLIPIPPLADQSRIVAILDKFDTLTTSITEGLPREIALRQKQYEHYRDQLLSFRRDAHAN